MRSFFLLAILGTLTLAQNPTSTCQCPEVKCPGGDAVDTCNCLNNRETMCKDRCPAYVPTYLPCPARPTSTPKPPTCECEPHFCPQIWPQSCHCANSVKQTCFEKCGGEQPALDVCPPLSTPSIITKTLPPVTRSSSAPVLPTSIKPVPQPSSTHAPCGGGRGNYLTCASGYVCINDPYSKATCGLECDGRGICVEDKLCGGFAGFSCQQKGMVCKDDPRDDCDPKSGGADCGGLCVWPH